MKVKVTDAKMVLDGMHKIANRITMGIVLAGMIVGASLLARVRDPLPDLRLSRAGHALLYCGRGRGLLAHHQDLCLGLPKPQDDPR